MSSEDPSEKLPEEPLEDGNEELMADEEHAEVEDELEAEAEAASEDEEAEADAEEDSEDDEAEGEADEESEEPSVRLDAFGQEVHMDWYVLKVTSNREDSIRDAIVRRIKILNLEDYVGEVVVPTEKVSEIKDGKKRVVERKFYPGYIMINMELNDDTWFAIRETPGVGDFVGAGGKPVPMTAHDVAKMLGRQEESEATGPRLKINFQKGDRVKIKEGTFENFEGDVEEVNEAKGLVRVMIKIFNRPTPVELEYWQVETV